MTALRFFWPFRSIKQVVTNAYICLLCQRDSIYELTFHLHVNLELVKNNKGRIAKNRMT